MTETERIKILIVDDHALVREGFHKLLEMEPEFTVAGEASSAKEALERTKELSPDIVLMDIKLPHVNGIEATRQLKRAFPDTEVVILSMFDEEEYVLEAFKAGAIGYVLKESSKPELIRAIKEAYSGRSLIDPAVARKVLGEIERLTKGPVLATKPVLVKALSDREIEVLQWVAEGKSNKEVADTLIISEKTVKAHLRSIFRKLEVGDRAQAVAQGMRKGLVE